MNGIVGPKLPPVMTPPKRLDWGSLILPTFFAFLAGLCFWRGNVLGGCIDLAVMATGLGFFIWRYISLGKLHRHYRVLKVLEQVTNTPRYEEVGNSIIFRFVTASPEIMEEFKAIHLSYLPKQKKGKK